MASVHDSGLGHGTNGSPQITTDEIIYENKVDENEELIKNNVPPIYKPSPKHEKGYG